MRSLHFPNGTPLLQSHGQIAADTSEQEWEQLILQALPQLYLAEHTPHIAAVYGLTKALVAPSVWHESWGRVATEANINGIPALVSNSGGLPEAIDIDHTLDHKQGGQHYLCQLLQKTILYAYLRTKKLRHG